MKISVNAYAKINLFLDIESVREDGYHNIISNMQSVTLHDEITVEHIESDTKEITVYCDNADIPCDQSNLVYKAADIFPVKLGNVKITISKVIPMSAGLAGGSADAAATLIALNQLLGDPLTLEELKAIGNRLGADVPFCIEKGSYIAKGTGEILEKTAPMPYFPIVIARKGEGMSTPYAYKALDNRYNKFLNYKPKEEKLLVLKEGSSISIEKYCEGMFNIFEDVVEQERPYVTELKNIMNNCGAVASMMSGSGTSVFGIFKDELDAYEALKALTEKEAFACICYPLKEK